MGWNLVDFSQFWLYLFFYYVKFADSQTSVDDFLPHIHCSIIVLAFIKVLFFVRIFQEYGFLVQMIILTLGDLVPFQLGFTVSLVFFALCFCVLGTGIEEEIEEVTGPGFNGPFGFWLLQVYRISLGEIGVPQYDDIAAEEESWSRDTHIALIWLTWLCITYVNIIILLNFLIAVISSTYERVTATRDITEYQHKADLNEECY